MVKMNQISISRLNSLYRNIELSNTSAEAWRFRVFHSNSGLQLKNAIQEVSQHGESLDQEHLKELKVLLQVSLTYSRILISNNPAEVFWSEHIASMKRSIEESKNYLDSTLQESLAKVLSLLESSAVSITSEFTTFIISEINAANGKILIVPETPRIGYFYRDWAIGQKFGFLVDVLTDKGEIQGKLFEEYALILFPGSPSKYLRRPFFDIYLRSLLFSGFSSRVTFISPDWASFKSDLTFVEGLFSGMKLMAHPRLELIQGESTIKIEENDLGQQDLEFIQDSSKSANFESFEKGGSVPCRLISLGDNLVYPVEHDSRRVTVIKKNPNSGNWEIDSKNPFVDLNPGDYIVACVGRSETNDLRDRAASKMGDQYSHFVASQINWKQLLQERLDSLGIKAFEDQLKKAGIKKFTRARFWILPEAIQPALPSDFQAILKELGFNPQEAQISITLADKFDSLLITEGREAGRALTNSLQEEDFMRLDKRLSVEITLENYGDATYLLSPVVEVSEAEIACRPSQVRQVISIENQDLFL
jgi:hypothetical protein